MSSTVIFVCCTQESRRLGQGAKQTPAGMWGWRRARMPSSRAKGTLREFLSAIECWDHTGQCICILGEPLLGGGQQQGCKLSSERWQEEAKMSPRKNAGMHPSCYGLPPECSRTVPWAGAKQLSPTWACSSLLCLLQKQLSCPSYGLDGESTPGSSPAWAGGLAVLGRKVGAWRSELPCPTLSTST